MLSSNIICSDAFAELPHEAQLLYMQINMAADDDGFVDCARSTARKFGIAASHVDDLIGAAFLIDLGDGVMAVKHWLINNSIRKDRYKPTKYLDKRDLLYVKDNGAYSLCAEGAPQDVDNDVSTGDVSASDVENRGFGGVSGGNGDLAGEQRLPLSGHLGDGLGEKPSPSGVEWSGGVDGTAMNGGSNQPPTRERDDAAGCSEERPVVENERVGKPLGACPDCGYPLVTAKDIPELRKSKDPDQPFCRHCRRAYLWDGGQMRWRRRSDFRESRKRKGRRRP